MSGRVVSVKIRCGLAWVLGLALCLLFATSLLSVSGTAAPTGKQELVVAMKDDIINLDPARLVSIEDHQIAFNIYNALLRFKVGSLSDLEPDLATSWSISSDGRVYTFELRRGVRWQKGYGEFTSEDVKYSFERILDPKTASPYRGIFSIVDRIETEGPYRVRIHLKQPLASFISTGLAYRPGLIVNRRAIEEKGENYVNDPVGTGPFVFRSRLPGERVVLARNTEYFGKRPNLETVVFKRINPETLVEIALRTGEVQLYYFGDPEVTTRVLRQRTLRTLQAPPTGTVFLYMHTTKQPWSDVRVRQAIAYVIDRKAIADHVFRGLARPANSIVPPPVLGYSPEDLYPLDLQRAKQLMAGAGVSRAAGTLLGFAGGENQADIAAVIKENVKAIGIELELDIVAEWPLQLERLRSERFDLAMTALGRRDPDQFYAVFHSQFRPYPNASHVTKFDKLIEEARTEADLAKRRQLYIALHRTVMQEVPTLPLVYLARVLAFRSDVQGAKASPDFAINLAEIWIGGP